MSTSWPSLLPDLVKGIPAAIVALLVGGIAAAIAYRQYRIARTKLKLDLFDKRYAIFEEVWGILSDVVQNGTQTKPNRGMGTPFNNLVPKAAFLFGADIEEYVDKVSEAWAKLWSLELPLQSQSPTPKEIAEAAELRRFFHAQASEGAKAIFGRYLSFDGWK